MTQWRWVIACAAFLALGVAVGRYTLPAHEETKISDAVISKTAYISRTAYKTSVERHEKIKWREVVKPDGTIEREGSSEINSHEKTDTTVATSEAAESKRLHEAVHVSTYSKPDWRVSAGVEFEPLTRLTPDYYVGVSRRILGPISLEGSVTANPNLWREFRAGVGISVEF